MKRTCFLALLVLGFAIAGCNGEETTPSDNDVQSDTSAETTETTEDTATDTAAEVTPPTLTDSTVKFTELIVTEIPNRLEIIFNALIGADMREGILIILVQSKEWNDQVDPPTCTVGGGGGIYNEAADTYSWDPNSAPSYGSGTLNGNRISNDEPITLNFPVHVGDDLFVVPLSKVLVEATYSDEGLSDGTITGMIMRDDANGIMVELPTGGTEELSSLLGGDETLNADFDEDGTMDAWGLAGTFEGVRITFAE